MKQVERDGAIIDFTIAGSGDTTLLFVPGSYIDQSYWNEQVVYFSPHYKVVTMDLPGQGKSGRERKHWSIEGFGQDVVTVIKELHLENVILIGHSLAGDVNLVAATAYPEVIRGFIGIDNFKNAATALPEAFREQAKGITEKLKTDFENTNEQYARMALLTPQTPKEITGRVVKDYRNAYKPMGIELMPEIFEFYKKEKTLLPQLKFKLYLINVNYMPTNEAALKQYARAGYELLSMEGTCHYPMIEEPEELNALLQLVIQKINASL